ncbi:MAG: sugar transferase [Muribaculaceae bacterium]|jgi:exopolysaccharide biosynthesis polyprenyl glycosylphosphotransferase
MGLTSDEPVDSVDESTREFAMHKAIKRIFDFVFALIAIVALTPVWVVLAVWIFLSSPGGVFFRQKRTGYRGETFEMLKFRSMYRNDKADEQQSTEGDPRVTPVGRFLRRSSLDELPQLWNVLVGDMSIIGPRPHMLQHTEYYSARIPGYMRRHDMRPGLTGYAQIKGFRGPTPKLEDMERRVKADLEYIDKFSLWLDLKIFSLTLWRMLTFKL